MAVVGISIVVLGPECGRLLLLMSMFEAVAYKALCVAFIEKELAKSGLNSRSCDQMGSYSSQGFAPKYIYNCPGFPPGVLEGRLFLVPSC